MVMSKSLSDWIEFVQRFFTSDPERAGTIFEKGVNIHPAQAVGAPSLMLEHFELVPVVPVQSVLGTEPHEALIILYDLVYSGLCHYFPRAESGEMDIFPF